MLFMFSVHDAAADAFITPFFLPSVAMAQREFGYCVNDPGHQFGRHAKDFSLYELGTFDPSFGTLKVHAEPRFVVAGVKLKAYADSSEGAPTFSDIHHAVSSEVKEDA